MDLGFSIFLYNLFTTAALFSGFYGILAGINAGAKPKETKSERLSYCSPNADCVFVQRATRPSKPSRIMAINTAIQIPALMMIIAAGLLMVSPIKYNSFKDFDLKSKVPQIAILGIVLAFALIQVDPPKVLFAVFFVYALSGPFYWLRNRKDKTEPLPSDKET